MHVLLFCNNQFVQKIEEHRFTITDITPMPVGSPDEVWEDLKKTIKTRGFDGLVLSILDHGSLISYGPKEVEIGFTKSFYKEQFETYLKTKPELMTVIEDLFGPVQTRVLVLSKRTSLLSEKPYSEPLDGQSDMHRAMRKEAMENSIVRAVFSSPESYCLFGNVFIRHKRPDYERRTRI